MEVDCQRPLEVGESIMYQPAAASSDIVMELYDVFGDYVECDSRFRPGDLLRAVPSDPGVCFLYELHGGDFVDDGGCLDFIGSLDGGTTVFPSAGYNEKNFCRPLGFSRCPKTFQTPKDQWLIANDADELSIHAGWAGGIGAVVQITPNCTLYRSNTIFDVLRSKNDLSVLADAIEVANITDFIDHQVALTLFAPTNDAFLKYNINASDLVDILLPHLLFGTVNASSLLNGTTNLTTITNDTLFASFDGNNLTLAFDQQCNNTTARVIEPDLQADNGIVHVIDDLLLL